MKKIIFEQTGNIILTVFMTLAICKTILDATYPTESSIYTFEINFSVLWLVFIGSVAVFSTAKYYYSKKWKSSEGYVKQDGELSAYDEREKMICFKATKVVYRVIIYFLAIMMVILMYSNLLIGSVEFSRIIGIAVLGFGLVITFFTYMISWIIFDIKL